MLVRRALEEAMGVALVLEATATVGLLTVARHAGLPGAGSSNRVPRPSFGGAEVCVRHGHRRGRRHRRRHDRSRDARGHACSRDCGARRPRQHEGSPSVTQPASPRATTVIGAVGGDRAIVVWVAVLSVLMLGELDVHLGAAVRERRRRSASRSGSAHRRRAGHAAGFFILLENQFDVGDVVELQTTPTRSPARSRRSRCGSRSLRQFDGTLTSCRTGTSRSSATGPAGWARAIVDVRVALRPRTPNGCATVLDELFDELAARAALAGLAARAARACSASTQLADNAQVIRVVAETRPAEPRSTRSGCCASASERASRRTGHRACRRSRRAAQPTDAPGVGLDAALPAARSGDPPVRCGACPASRSTRSTSCRAALGEHPTWPTAGSRPRSTSRSRSTSRCCSRARRASARPRSRRCSPRCSAAT